MANIRTPKTWAEVKEIYEQCNQNLTNLISITKQESVQLLNFVSQLSDGSGIIEACIHQFPQYVPHVRKIKDILEQMNECYKCISNNSWLKSQPEWNEDFSDSDDSDSSGGKIINLYNNYESSLKILNDVNLDIKQLMTLTYQLQHGKDLFYARNAIRDLSKKMAKEQSKTKSQEQIKEQTHDMFYNKQKNIGR